MSEQTSLRPVVHRYGRRLASAACFAGALLAMLASEAVVAGEQGTVAPPAPVAPEDVIGPDQRARVIDTTRRPFRSIGSIRALGYLDPFCTGTVIGPRHVLTAAHCLYDTEINQNYKVVGFTPARNGRLEPFGELPVKKTFVPNGWKRATTGAPSPFDYGLIVLARPVGNVVGVLPFKSRSRLDNVAIKIVGYPNEDVRRFIGSMVRSARCRGNRRADLLLSYRCDTEAGMSGSPVFALGERGFISQRPTIIAVHSGGSPTRNVGVPITPAVERQLRSWIARN